jgi:hypothetical protein
MLRGKSLVIASEIEEHIGGKLDALVFDKKVVQIRTKKKRDRDTTKRGLKGA